MNGRLVRRLCVIGALVAARSAQAQREAPRVVSVDGDAEIDRAMTTALKPWHAALVALRGPVPGRDIDDAIRTAHRYARQARAIAVVWVARDAPPASTWSLWIYDDRAHAIAVRSLASTPPFDDVSSAAVALTVRTMLRDLLSAAPAPREPELEPAPAPPPPPPPRWSVRLLSTTGLRLPTHATDVVMPRFGAELTLFPGPLRQVVGFALGVDAGSAITVDRAPAFIGSYSDVVVSAGLRVRLPLRRWASLELGSGPGLHLGTLAGSSPAADVYGSTSPRAASIESALGIELAIGMVRVGPSMGTSFLLYRYRYHLGPARVLDVPTAQICFGLRLGVELP